MWTLRTLTNDFLTSFKQINPEKKVNFNQALFWITTIANRLKSQHIGKSNAQSYLHVFPEIPLQISETSDNTVVQQRKYIELPRQVYDYNYDKGINYIAFGHNSDVCGRPGFTFGQFTRITASEAHRLYLRSREKPSLENVYWYRVHDIIYFLGLEDFPGTYLEAGLFITFNNLADVDIDEAFDFPEELIMILQRHVYDLGRFVLLVPKDFKNDAIPETNTNNLAGQKLTSVNDPIQQV